jgi:hypothetical protein
MNISYKEVEPVDEKPVVDEKADKPDKDLNSLGYSIESQTYCI